MNFDRCYTVRDDLIVFCLNVRFICLLSPWELLYAPGKSMLIHEVTPDRADQSPARCSDAAPALNVKHTMLQEQSLEDAQLFHASESNQRRNATGSEGGDGESDWSCSCFRTRRESRITCGQRSWCTGRLTPFSHITSRAWGVMLLWSTGTQLCLIV